MAISEFELKRCEKEMDKFLAVRRPPVHIRNQLDFGYRIENQSVTLFEITPNWQNSAEKIECGFAKATYVKKDKIWKIYWQRKDLNWHSYKPAPSLQFFEDFLSIVNEDANACFFG